MCDDQPGEAALGGRRTRIDILRHAGAAVCGDASWSPGRGGGTLENDQAYMPGAGGFEDHAELPVAARSGAQERTRTLSLIDFLADYDARRNPPVY
jgi:hypothetical protein